MCGGGTSRGREFRRRRDQLAARTGDEYKVVIIGDSGVGKTCIMMQFLGEAYVPAPATTGVDFITKAVHIGDKKINLQIWDTAGQERFSVLTPNFLRGALGVIIVYDITSQASFDNFNSQKDIPSWMSQVNTIRATDPNLPLCKLIVGNKSDIRDIQVVQTSTGEDFATSFQYDFMEVSAKTGENIQRLFASIAQSICALNYENREVSL